VQADGASADGSFSRGLLNPDADVPSVVKGLTPKRYAVYRNNVTVSLVRAIEANFPAVRRLLGDVYFAGLAREYVQAHPPQSPLMFLFGAEFPDYLAGQDDLAEFPYLSDVARLEQQWRVSYHAADDPVLDVDAISKLDPEQLMSVIFVPHAAFKVLQSQFALFDIFTANRGREAAIGDFAIAQDVLVTRPELDVLIHQLPHGASVFLNSLAQGLCLGEAAENAATQVPSFDLAATLALMIATGAFTSLSLQME
jgi:Putative DNA-binding domain